MAVPRMWKWREPANGNALDGRTHAPWGEGQARRGGARSTLRRRTSSPRMPRASSLSAMARSAKPLGTWDGSTEADWSVVASPIMPGSEQDLELDSTAAASPPAGGSALNPSCAQRVGTPPGVGPRGSALKCRRQETLCRREGESGDGSRQMATSAVFVRVLTCRGSAVTKYPCRSRWSRSWRARRPREAS